MLAIDNPKWNSVPRILYEILQVLYRIEGHGKSVDRAVTRPRSRSSVAR